MMSDLIACLYKIAEAIREKKQNENNENNDNENNTNYTWYDFIKENCVDHVTPYLEQSNFDDKRNPIPVGIYDFDNDSVIFFKDVNINENIIDSGIKNCYVVYEESPRLYQNKSTDYCLGSLQKIDSFNEVGKPMIFVYAESSSEIDQLEYNGKTYYYSYFMSD